MYDFTFMVVQRNREADQREIVPGSLKSEPDRLAFGRSWCLIGRDLRGWAMVNKLRIFSQRSESETLRVQICL